MGRIASGEEGSPGSSIDYSPLANRYSPPYWAATTIASPSATRLTPNPQALASRPV
jgi:hypothetical protein